MGEFEETAEPVEFDAAEVLPVVEALAAAEDGKLALTWDAVDQRLETAPAVVGPWSTVPATSPYVVTPAPDKLTAFFRRQSQP